MMTQEPGDLPDAVVLSCGRGVPGDTRFSSHDDSVWGRAGDILPCRSMLPCDPFCWSKGDFMSIFKTLLLTTAIVAPATAWTQEIPGEINKDEIVVTASRTYQPLSQVGQSISIIDQEEITRQQSVAVVDLLRTLPGLTITRNGGLGSVTGVNIRGAESDQTVALIDGVKINDPSAPGGGFYFANMLTGNIARIEVVRGSQSVLWGSQAIGGVINMITRTPDEKLSVNANAEYGWHDTGNVVGNVSGAFGPVAATIGGSYYTTDGISAFNEARGGMERDSFRNYGANAKFIVTLSDAFSLDLRGYYTDGKVGNDGFAPPTYAFGDTPEYAKTREFIGYAGANLTLLDGRFRNRLAYAYTDTNRESVDPTGGVPFITFDGKGRNKRYEYQGTLDLSDAIFAVFGAEREISRYSASSFGGPVGMAKARIDSLYGQISVTPIVGLTATAGIRHDDHSRFGSNTTVSANAVYSPNDGATTVRASFGEGFKAPSLYQLFGDYGNTALQPETSKSWDAGVTQKLLDGAMELGATWFHRKTNNQIDFISCFGNTSAKCVGRPFGTYDNIRRTQAQGLEVGIALHPVEALTFAANYTWTDAENRDTGLDLARRARHKVNTSIDYAWAFGLSTGASVTHVSGSFDNASNTRRLEGYVLVDLRASMKVTDNIALYGRIENLFNERYETVFQYGTAGRAAYAGVRLSY